MNKDGIISVFFALAMGLLASAGAELRAASPQLTNRGGEGYNPLIQADTSAVRADSSAIHVFRLYYRLDEVRPDRSYLDNEANMEYIVGQLRNSPHIDSIVIHSYASPEGVFEHNRWLARRRGEAAKKFILDNLPEESTLKPDKIILQPTPEDWDGLRSSVLKSYHRRDREKVLDILDAQVGNDTKKWRLQQLDGGASWKWILRNLMPQLRQATWVCVWEEAVQERPVTETLPQPPAPAFALETADLGSSVCFNSSARAKTLIQLKTNLLYDAVTALNFEIEIPVGQHFSIVASDLFPWWTWGPNDRKYAFQIWEIGFEPRWYPFSGLGNGYHDGRMSGAFVGAYLASAAYDLQWDTAICTQGEYWTAGLSAGYVFPLGRRLRAELSAAIGFLSSDYRQYQPDPDYEHLYRDPFRTGTFSYFGPTRLKASLVLPISVRRGVKSGPFNIVAR